jgi:hypothetical protein
LSLVDLASRYEKLTNQQEEQYYNQEAGLTYDRGLMKKLALELTGVAKEFLEKFSEPRRMYLASIATIASAERLDVELDFNDRRMEKISTEKYKIEGKKVNWGNWRQFNSITEDAKRRKEVFDEFISKASQIASLVEKRMGISRQSTSVMVRRLLSVIWSLSKHPTKTLCICLRNSETEPRKHSCHRQSISRPRFFTKAPWNIMMTFTLGVGEFTRH